MARLPCAHPRLPACNTRVLPRNKQIAVLKEVDGKGPFCSLVMAVVVVKDVIVIIAYAINVELIRVVSAEGCLPAPGAATAAASTTTA